MDEVAIDRLRVIEIVGVERGQRKDGGAAKRDLGALLQPDAQLLAHEAVSNERGGFLRSNSPASTPSSWATFASHARVGLFLPAITSHPSLEGRILARGR